MKLIRLLFLTACFAAILPGSSYAQTDTAKAAALETLGVQGSAVLYNSFLLVGAMHDGYSVSAWDKEFTLTALEEQRGIMLTIATSYDNLSASGYLDEEDSIAIMQMKECCMLIRKEADCLIDYVDTGSETAHERYFIARMAAWNALSELLGIDEATGLGEIKTGSASGTR